MIRLDRSKTPAPGVLEADGEAGDLERKSNEIAQTKNAKLKFKVYRDPAVKAALTEVFGRKCCYCESLLLGTQSGDIEHYRPKSRVAVHNADRTTVTYKGGYHWLASRWTNLLCSCADCNRPRTQLDDNEEERTFGKANFFPVADEGHRATSADGVAAEAALLLDPCVDQPEEHLIFTDDGKIQPKAVAGAASERGEATIHYCGLARAELLQMRAKHARTVKASIRHIIKALEANQDPGPDLEDLLKLLDPTGAYVAFTRHLVSKLLRPYIEQLNLPV
jgi:uncharacterized protein (TIGR02646 family)